MKKITCMLLLCLPLLANAQRTLTFTLMNAQTGRPWPRVWYNLRGDVTTNADFGRSDSNGVCRVELRPYVQSATYQVEVNNQYDAVTPGMYDVTKALSGQYPVIWIFPGNKAAPNPCGERLYPGYKPKSIFNLADMPAGVQAKFKAMLLNRVGQQFYNRLVLNLGQEIDIERYMQKSGDLRIPPAYSLCMSVTDTATHEEIYSFRVNLDQQGNLIGILGIPDIKNHPEKAKILSDKQAAAIAQFNGVYDRGQGEYDGKLDAIVWQFEKMDKFIPGGGNTPFTIIRINAHNGSIISKETVTKMVQY